MLSTFFALTIAFLQPILSQELQIIPKKDFDLQILPRASNNLGCGCQNNLIPPNNFVRTCQLCQGQNKLIREVPCGCKKFKCTTNNIECGCPKHLNVVSRNNLGCSCQGQKNMIPQNYPRCSCNNNIGCRCQAQNNFLRSNRCGYQSQDILIPPKTFERKKQPEFLVPISNIWYKSQKPYSLIPVNDIGCKCRAQNIIPTNNNGCGCQKQKNNMILPKICACQNIGCKCNRQTNVIPPSVDGCGCQRPLNIIPMQNSLIAHQIPRLPFENELTTSNSFSVTDLPITILPNELSNGFSRGKDLLRRSDLSELKSHLSEMTDESQSV